jgi:acetoin utilization deacetylase AcuC-like enzyme
MSSRGFAVLTRCLMTLADNLCAGRLVLVLEGGYHPVSLAESIAAVLAELCGMSLSSDADILASHADFKRLDPVLIRSRHVHQSFWRSLRQARPKTSA